MNFYLKNEVENPVMLRYLEMESIIKRYRKKNSELIDSQIDRDPNTYGLRFERALAAAATCLA